MKKTLLTAVAATAVFGFLTAAGASAQLLTISEVYPGGGWEQCNSQHTTQRLSSSCYNTWHDHSIDMSTYAVYYKSATWHDRYTAAAELSQRPSCTLGNSCHHAGSYYLIAEAQGAFWLINTARWGLNVAGSINLSGTAGDVVLGLANSDPSLSAYEPVPFD